MSNTILKTKGFEGELIIDIPKVAIAQSKKTPLIHSLFIARMGYFPKALHHFCQRPAGIPQVIFLYCTHGTGWIQYKKKEITIKAGEVFLIPKRVPHSYGSHAENPWTIYWLHLIGSQCDEAVSAIMNHTTKTTKNIQAGFSEERNNIFRQISSTLLKGYSKSNLLFANLLLPSYLATFITPKNMLQEALPVLNATDKAILFMQQNTSRLITLENIAQAAHLSVSFFCRKFKQDTGYAPIEYFNHLRIQKACQLLHFTKLRINEVASRIGIDDPFYFSRLFKQQMGISPVAYKKNEVGD